MPVLSPGIKIIDSFPSPIGTKYDSERWYQQHTNHIVIFNCTASNIYFPDHWTPLSIKCAFKGQEYYHFHDKSLAVGEGNFLILNEGAIYSSSIESTSPTESFTLNFTPQNISDVLAALVPLHRQLEDPLKHFKSPVQFVEKLYSHNSNLSQQLFHMRELIKGNEREVQPYLERVYAILENMILLQQETELEIDQFKAVKRSTKIEMYKRLTCAKDYMDSCFYEDITLHQLSRLCLLNPYYLLKQFKKFYHITPHQYLMKCRLEAAKSLLLKTDIGIGELVKNVGFTDPSSFTKLFKRYCGLPPEKYRNKNNYNIDY